MLVSFVKQDNCLSVLCGAAPTIESDSDPGLLDFVPGGSRLESFRAGWMVAFNPTYSPLMQCFPCDAKVESDRLDTFPVFHLPVSKHPRLL